MKTFWLLLILVACGSVNAQLPELQRFTETECYEAWNGLRSLSYNPAVHKVLPFGQPNAHHPWRFPGGITNPPASFSYEIYYSIPGTVEVYRGNGYVADKNLIVPYGLYRWTFPIGTVAEVRLFDSGKLFVSHRSTKVRSGSGIASWDGEELSHADAPSYYKSPSNCQTCHQDIKEYGRNFESNKNYYDFIRGDDGRFSWHPFKPSLNSLGFGDLKLRSDRSFRVR